MTIEESQRRRRTTLRFVMESPRILVVEDDPGMRELIADVLAFEGYFVTDVADATAMLRAVVPSRDGEEAFVLIITDMRMPGSTGLEALARLRAIGCWIPTIVVTAFPEEVVKRQASELGALLLPKPFALDRLRALANRILAKRRLC